MELADHPTQIKQAGMKMARREWVRKAVSAAGVDGVSPLQASILQVSELWIGPGRKLL